MHKLRIILEVGAKGLQSGFRSASAAVKGFLSGLSSMASSGRRFLDSLAQSVFFLGNAFGMLKNIAQGLFDRFVGGARDAAKLEVKLKHIVGSSEDAARVMDYMRAIAERTGTEFEGLASGAVLLAVASKDASGALDFGKFERLTNLLMQMTALRPDLPVERLTKGLQIFAMSGEIRSLEMYLDIPLRQLMGIKDAADDVADVPGEIGKAATYIETGVARAGKEATMTLDQLEEAMTRVGASAEMVQEMADLAGMERFDETWKSIARTLGEPLFEAINEGMAELAQWLQDNPEMIEQFATALGKLGAAGVENVFEAITKLISDTDWDAFFDKAIEFVEKLTAGDIEGAFAAIGAGELGESLTATVEALGAIAEILVSVAEALGADVPKGVQAAADIGKAFVGGKEERAAVGEKWYGQAAGKGQAIVQEAISGPAGMENVRRAVATELANILGINIGQKPQQVEVVVRLDSDLLNAQITQTSEGVVTDSFNQLGEHMKGTH